MQADTANMLLYEIFRCSPESSVTNCKVELSVGWEVMDFSESHRCFRMPLKGPRTSGP